MLHNFGDMFPYRTAKDGWTVWDWLHTGLISIARKYFANRLNSLLTGQGVAAHADGGRFQGQENKSRKSISDLH